VKKIVLLTFSLLLVLYALGYGPFMALYGFWFGNRYAADYPRLTHAMLFVQNGILFPHVYLFSHNRVYYYYCSWWQNRGSGSNAVRPYEEYYAEYVQPY
jgi:hypothetical protein